MNELAWLPEKFRAIRPLGRGGMGEVWLVEESATGGALACKFLKLDLPEAERQPARLRFKREYLVLSRLTHPGLARAHELLETAGAIAYTMDFVKGWPLQEYFLAGHWTGGAEPAPAPTPLFHTTTAGVERVLAAGVELLDMLSWLHGSGIIHRDLKPANLMVEASGKLRMIDFGLARAEHEVIEVTRVGEILGTPSYIAPELIRGQRLDGRSDLYAVGVILYELLTGKPPFSGAPAQVLMAHLNQAPRPPRELNPVITGPLSGYVLRLLAKTPQARFASADEARQGLLAAADRSGSVDVTTAMEPPGPLDWRGMLLTTPYEGNQAAVEAVRELCKALHEQGRGALALVSGSAGSGKSRLLDELQGMAVERGVRVLRGACHEGSAGHLFNELLRPLTDEMARHADRSAKWLGEDGELLAHYFPVLRRIPGLGHPKPPDLEPASARAQLMGALYGFFSRFARDERVILAAEDLHWADGATLELLAHLIRSFTLADASESPLAVVASYRHEEVAASPGLEKWLAGWKGERVARLRLKPLSPEEVSRLIREALGEAQPPGDSTLAAVCDLTGGNPFFVLELLRRSREEEARHDSGHWSLGRWLREEREALPESLSAALKRRLADLGEAGAEPLAAAAILGRSFEFSVWKEVSGLDEDALFELSEKAFKLEILSELGADRLQFHHELFRRQLLQGMSGLKQRRLHGKAVKALIARPDAAALHGGAIARHAIAAGMKAEAVRYGLPAADAVLKVGEYEQTWQMLEGIGALFSEADPLAPDDEIEWKTLRGILLVRRGSLAEATAMLEQARDRLRETPAGAERDRREINILVGMTMAYYQQGQSEKRLAIARERYELARSIGDDELQGSALRFIARGLSDLGDIDGAREHLARAEAHLPGIGNRGLRLKLEGGIANSHAIIESELGRVNEAVKWNEKGLAIARSINDKGKIAINNGNLGEVEVQLGRLALARRRLEETRKLNEEIGDRSGITDNLNSLGMCAMHQDRLDEAEELLTRAQRVADETENRYFATYNRIYQAKVFVEKGDRDRARVKLDEAAASAEKMSNLALQAKSAAARAALELGAGDKPAALAAAERALALSGGRFPGDDAQSRAVAAAARLAPGLLAEQLAPLLEQFHQAVAAALKLENVPLEFELRLIAAEALHAAGHPAEAVTLLADTGLRARAAGFLRYTDRADRIQASLTAPLSGPAN